MTQQQLADEVNKTRPLISSIEQKGKVNIHTLRKICEVLDLDPDRIEDTANEPMLVYGKNTSQKEELLELEVLQLKKEISQLNDLVDSQKELILLLKEKTTRR